MENRRMRVTIEGHVYVSELGSMFLKSFRDCLKERIKQDNDEIFKLIYEEHEASVLIPTLMVGLDELAKDLGYKPADMYEMMLEVCRETDKELGEE